MINHEDTQSGRARNPKKEGNHEWTRMHTNEDKLFVLIRGSLLSRLSK